jgi:hypothetical protein
MGMTMAESHVITGLVAKRAEITGQIEAYQAELSRLQSSVAHLDYTIKLFAPEYDLRSICGKRTHARNQYLEHGEAQRHILDILRTAVKPMSSRDIVDVLLERKGIAPTAILIAKVQKIILGALHRLEKRGIVIATKADNGSRSQIKFSIA